MTRETKIGLLVGLAFIIVIGILLSDHINSSTDPVPAAMSQTYDSVQRSVGSPDQRNQGTMTVIAPPAPMIPQNPVATTRDPLPPGTPGSTIVEITPGGDPSQVRFPRAPQPPVGSNIDVLPPASGNEVANNVPDNTAAPLPPGGASDPLVNLVNQHQNDLTMNGSKPPVGIPAAVPPAPAPGVGRQVKAEENDNVTKFAIKYMGANTKANREAIIRANPSMTPDGHVVIVGRTYVIPVPAGAPAGAVAQNVPPAPRPAPTPAPAPAPAPAPSATINYYTVKEGESLWKISSEQLGSGARYTEIRDLNPDVLKGSDNVHVGMRLKLPPKAVASSN